MRGSNYRALTWETLVFCTGGRLCACQFAYERRSWLTACLLFLTFIEIAVATFSFEIFSSLSTQMNFNQGIILQTDCTKISKGQHRSANITLHVWISKYFWGSCMLYEELCMQIEAGVSHWRAWWSRGRLQYETQISLQNSSNPRGVVKASESSPLYSVHLLLKRKNIPPRLRLLSFRKLLYA